MKKALALAALAAMAFFATGCAITDYPVITDDDQTNASTGAHIVNTSGQAIIVPEMQVATIFPDGSDELLTWVDQKANGDQVLYTRNNFCAAGAPCSAFPFAGFTYVNNDSTGCWIWRAQNPVDGDVDIFDGDFNGNCDGARSLLLLASVERSAEGGKDASGGNGGGAAAAVSSALPQSFAGVSVLEYVQALARLNTLGEYGDHRADYGIEGWKFNITPENFEFWLSDTRFMFDGVTAVVDIRNNLLVIDLRGSNAGDMLLQMADWVDSNGHRATLTASFAGISPSFEVGLLDSDHYRDLAARAF